MFASATTSRARCPHQCRDDDAMVPGLQRPGATDHRGPVHGHAGRQARRMPRSDPGSCHPRAIEILWREAVPHRDAGMGLAGGPCPVPVAPTAAAGRSTAGRVGRPCGLLGGCEPTSGAIPCTPRQDRRRNGRIGTRPTVGVHCRSGQPHPPSKPVLSMRDPRRSARIRTTVTGTVGTKLPQTPGCDRTDRAVPVTGTVRTHAGSVRRVDAAPNRCGNGRQESPRRQCRRRKPPSGPGCRCPRPGGADLPWDLRLERTRRAGRLRFGSGTRTRIKAVLFGHVPKVHTQKPAGSGIRLCSDVKAGETIMGRGVASCITVS